MQSLEQCAKSFGLALSIKQLEQFETYRTILIERNQVMNLTAITAREEAETRHFLDSLALFQVADLKGKRLIDIGTGAGFPGIPLKIAEPTLELTLLDSLAKRVDFLEEVCDSLGLEQVHCLHARAEEWVAEEGVRESHDYATSRAVARLNMLAELALPYVKPGGAFLAMKTSRAEEEIAEARAAIALLGGEIEREYDYTLPGTDVAHRIVVIRKVAETPARYPRRFARIQKQPLK